MWRHAFFGAIHCELLEIRGQSWWINSGKYNKQESLPENLDMVSLPSIRGKVPI